MALAEKMQQSVASVGQQVQTQMRRLSGKEVGVPVRKLGQHYDKDIPVDWFRNNAFASMFFIGFSAKLPEGEAQFMHSVRLFQDRITDPVLQAQVRAFIGQEAHHSKEHEALNAMLESRGYSLKRIESSVRWHSQWQQKHWSPQEQLAFTVCAEHITALLSDYLLRRRPELLEQMAPVMAKLWAWHAIEETEHKAVAFDVYDQLVADRGLLYRTMVGFTLVFLVSNTLHAAELTIRHARWRDWRMWKAGFALLGELLQETRSDYLDFYRRDFHPWDLDNRDALAQARRAWLEPQGLTT